MGTGLVLILMILIVTLRVTGTGGIEGGYAGTFQSLSLFKSVTNQWQIIIYHYNTYQMFFGALLRQFVLLQISIL